MMVKMDVASYHNPVRKLVPGHVLYPVSTMSVMILQKTQIIEASVTNPTAVI